MTTAPANPAPTGDSVGRHLRPRDSSRKSIGTGGVAADSSDPASKIAQVMMMSTTSEEDAEMAAATTASHYLGYRGISAKRKFMDGLITIHNTPKKPRINITSAVCRDSDSPNSKIGKELTDVYCWECHKECVENALDCVTCPRTFHPNCAQQSNSGVKIETEEMDIGHWTCPVCTTIMKAECADTRSWSMQQLNVDQLCTLLGFALQRMKHPDSEAFHNPVPKSLLPDYYEIVFHPIDLCTLDKNIKRKMYASTEAFLEDAKWILHNSMIYNGTTSKYTADAKMIIKICKHEMSEIELCPDCYLNSCVRKDNWFAEPCTYPHCLVWAKLKGFPYWPAKALRVSVTNNVDVRFFGAHDRAWIPINQAFLLSEECPNPLKNVRKFGFDKAMDELHLHIEKLKNSSANINFRYAPLKTEFKSEYLYNCSLLFGNDVSSAAEKRTVNLIMATQSSSTNDTAGRTRRLSGGSSNHSEDLTDTGNLFDSAAASSSFCPQPEIMESIVDTSTASQCNDEMDVKLEQHPETGLVMKLKAKKQITRPTVTMGREENKQTLSINGGGGSTPPVNTRVASRSSEQKLSAEDEECLSVFENIQLSLQDQPPVVAATTPCVIIDDAQRIVDTEESAARDAGYSSFPTEQLERTLTSEIALPAKSPSRERSEQLQLSNPVSSSSKASFTTVHKTVQAVSQLHALEHCVNRKRSLQSVLARMHNHVQQMPSSTTSNENRGSTPVLVVAPAPAVRTNPQSTTATCSKMPSESFNTEKSKSKLIEKYVQQITCILSPAISSMLKEYQEISSSDVENPHSKRITQNTQVDSTNSSHSIKMKWFYQEATRAMRNTAKTTFSELQQAIEAEKNAALDEQRRKLEEEKIVLLKDTKSKQWCASCGKEAVFYCCWNTSYCDYPCQQQHWGKHQTTCTQIRSANNNHNTSSNNNGSGEYSMQQTTPAVMTQSASSFNTLSSALQFTNNLAGSATVNTSTPTNVVPVYAVPASGYYKASIPTAVTLDLNAAANGQYVAIQPRQPIRSTTAAFAPPLNSGRKR